MLIILQHSGFENAQLVQLLLYAALKLLQMLFDWFCELLRLAATQCKQTRDVSVVWEWSVMLCTLAETQRHFRGK